MGGTLTKIWRFYIDGFKNMTWGRQLWVVILVKLFIMFAILKVFFFPDFLKGKTDEEKSDFVSTELVRRIPPENENKFYVLRLSSYGIRPKPYRLVARPVRDDGDLPLAVRSSHPWPVFDNGHNGDGLLSYRG